MSEPPFDSARLINSFLIVVANYVLLVLGTLVIMLLISAICFPEVFAIWTADPNDPENLRHVWDREPARLWPPMLCVSTLVSAVVLSIAAGWSTTWMAPFSKFAHGIFLAMISLVTFLQIAISHNTRDAIPHWFLIGLLVLVPCGVI
ncbi:MAG: hypothetical protein GTO41_21975, partial [Burkholderiales bacterium]|nr:hypothetical protein [Burkholderiales bacterium]